MTLMNLPGWLPLADAVVKATVILAVAAGASLVLRRASAALRHLVWTLALFASLAVPLLTLALPKWEVPLVTVASTAVSIAPASDPGIAAIRPRSPRGSSAVAVNESSAVAATDPIVSTPQAASWRARASALAGSITWLQAIVAIWLIGAFAMVLRMAVGFAAVQWLSRRTQEVTDANWLPLAHRLAGDMGVTPALRFLRSARATMPVAAGIFRPAVIMPADADTWSENRLRIVLLHELAHVKRRDCLTHLVAQLACALYWFNPLAWIAARRARSERERACDDLVLASGTRGSEYADQLLEIARVMRGDSFGRLLSGASLAMAHRSQLEGRLIAILDPKLPRAGVSRARGLAAALLCSCAVAPLAALQPWSESVTVDGPTMTIQTTVADADNAQNPAADNLPQPAARAQMPQTPQLGQAPQLGQEPQLAQDRRPTPQPMPDPHPSAVFHETVAEIATHVTTPAFEKEFEKSFEKEAAFQDPKPSTPKPAGERRQADPRMIAALTAALKDTDKEVRETAMHALVQLRDPSIFDPLVQALKDASPDVREQAAHGLGQLRDRRAVDPLIGALKDENADVREQAAHALGQLREKTAVPGLTAALKDAAADVREQAAFALGQLRDPSAVEGLAIAVRDANPDVREQAVFALSQIRDRRAVEPLISALKDTNADVRQQAAFALGQLRDPRAVEPLIIAIKDADADVREQVCFALGQIRDPRAIDALTGALKDQNADVRQQAAFALGQLAR